MQFHSDYEVQLVGDLGTSPKANEEKVKTKIVWKNVVLYIYFHITALYGIYLCFASAKWPTIIWGTIDN